MIASIPANLQGISRKRKAARGIVAIIMLGAVCHILGARRSCARPSIKYALTVLG